MTSPTELVVEARLASPEDVGDEAGRRLTYVLRRGPDRVLVRTVFDSPTAVRVLSWTGPRGAAFEEALAAEVRYWAPQVAAIEFGGSSGRYDAAPVSWIRLTDVRPSQTSIDSAKLAAMSWVRRREDVVLSGTTLAGQWVCLDGHTRALAAWRAGVTTIGIVEESEVNRAFVQARSWWCLELGIGTWEDLSRHVVSTEEHLAGYVARCRAWLAANEPGD